MFPPGKSGGLIEARMWLAVTISPEMFPPGKSGGLIEAGDAGQQRGVLTRFRRVNPAASLKHRSYKRIPRPG